jgi:hypothetical protein
MLSIHAGGSRLVTQEDQGSKPAQANRWWDPISKKTHHKKKKKKRVGGAAQKRVGGPYVQAPVPQKKS